MAVMRRRWRKDLRWTRDELDEHSRSSPAIGVRPITAGSPAGSSSSPEGKSPGKPAPSPPRAADTGATTSERSQRAQDAPSGGPQEGCRKRGTERPAEPGGPTSRGRSQRRRRGQKEEEATRSSTPNPGERPDPDDVKKPARKRAGSTPPLSLRATRQATGHAAPPEAKRPETEEAFRVSRSGHATAADEEAEGHAVRPAPPPPLH